MENINKEQLNILKEKLSLLSEEEKKKRDLYLRDVSLGKIEGTITGYPSIDKPWLKYYSEEAITRKKPTTTVFRMIYDSNKDYLNNNALQYFNKFITYGELFQNIEKVAKSLRANDISTGDIISVCLPSIPESVYIFYAVSKIGAIANMIDPRASAKDIKHYVNEVNSTLVITLEDIISKFNEIVSDTTIQKIVKVSATNSLTNDDSVEKEENAFSNINNSSVELVNFNSFVEDGQKFEGNTEVEYSKDRAVVIEHTGGTTGTPKGVLLTNDALNMVAHNFLISDLKFDRTQKWLNIMPPFIAYGVGNGLHLPLIIGMCVIEVPKFEPNKIDELIAMYHPNNFTGVPIHYESIINSDKLDSEDFSKWILPGVGGDTMDSKLEEKANEFLKSHGSKTKVIKGYGLTEVCAAACVTFGEANEIGSVGIPFVHNNISIFEPSLNDENIDESNNYIGNELSYNETGEICIFSPSLMLGYYNNETETNIALHRHSDNKIWLHTGDIGYMTENGLLYIKGRSKRVIIRHDGFKVFPFAAENLISTINEVAFCKVIATPDINHIQGYLPQAVIILKDEFKNDQDNLKIKIQKECEQHLAEYAIPTDYKFVDEFPRTAVGKVDYVAMENENNAIQRKRTI